MKPPASIVRLMGRLQARRYRRSGGRKAAHFGKAPILVLTTTGRRSGLPRDAPLVYIEASGVYWVVGSFGGRDEHPAWVHNLRASPEATALVGATAHAVRARPASAEERPGVWARLCEVYPAYAAYERRTSRRFAIFALEPRR